MMIREICPQPPLPSPCCLALAGALACFTVAPRAAQAAPTEAAEGDTPASRARLLMRAGILHFNEGDLESAVKEMQTAYRLFPAPQIQYNLALCYERQGNLAAAATAYETYLNGSPNADDRAEVMAKLGWLRAEAARPRVQGALGEVIPGATPPEPPPATEPPAAAQSQPAEKVIFKPMVVFRDKPVPAGRNARLASAGLLVLGGVTAASAIAFAVVGARTLSQLDEQEQIFKDGVNNPPGSMMTASTTPLPDACNGNTVNTAFIDAIVTRNPMENREGITNGTSNICVLKTIGQNAARANFIAAGVGGVISLAALGGSLALSLYGRKLDRRQAAALAASASIGNERRSEARLMDRPSLSLAPLWLPGGGGALIGLRF